MSSAVSLSSDLAVSTTTTANTSRVTYADTPGMCYGAKPRWPNATTNPRALVCAHLPCGRDTNRTLAGKAGATENCCLRFDGQLWVDNHDTEYDRPYSCSSIPPTVNCLLPNPKDGDEEKFRLCLNEGEQRGCVAAHCDLANGRSAATRSIYVRHVVVALVVLGALAVVT